MVSQLSRSSKMVLCLLSRLGPNSESWGFLDRGFLSNVGRFSSIACTPYVVLEWPGDVTPSVLKSSTGAKGSLSKIKHGVQASKQDLVSPVMGFDCLEIGLELHTGVFNAEKQKKIAECIMIYRESVGKDSLEHSNHQGKEHAILVNLMFREMAL
ncbi:hypothetical protein SLEP1_g51558 [Rubroshorea leprosula]|uniref:Uncharacterized protein n=1 Tax=Rubroshorea leprosula TaxID=152421 RepID=A0AAV5M3M5_9ROSI|nr:hypothetical protein SLEP1_g51558 [Rubroshorea leprosula]